MGWGGQTFVLTGWWSLVGYGSCQKGLMMLRGSILGQGQFPERGSAQSTQTLAPKAAKGISISILEGDLDGSWHFPLHFQKPNVENPVFLAWLTGPYVILSMPIPSLPHALFSAWKSLPPSGLAPLVCCKTSNPSTYGGIHLLWVVLLTQWSFLPALWLGAWTVKPEFEPQFCLLLAV